CIYLLFFPSTMPPLTTSSTTTLLRACTRQHLTGARSAAVTATSQQRRGRATEAAQTSSFDSPFGRSHESSSTLKIPSFKKYASSGNETSNKVFSYFMAGSMGLITAVGAKATVHGMPSTLLSSIQCPVYFFDRFAFCSGGLGRF